MSAAARAARVAPWLLVAGGAAVMVLRASQYFTAPGFWAEEGMLFYVYARAHSAAEALAYRPAGYLLAWANVATLLAARLVPPLQAPLVTTLLAFAVQTLPLWLIAFGRAPFWQGIERKSLGIAVVLFGGLTGEIWLNTINSQFWLVLATVLILLEPPPVGRARDVAYLVVLLLAGLNGPGSAALAPLFLWKAWREHDDVVLSQGALLGACAGLQLWCLWSATASDPNLPSRATGLSVGVAGAIVWMKTLVLPTLGSYPAERFARRLEIVTGDLASSTGMLAGLVLLVAAATVLVWVARGARRDERLVLLGSYVVVTALTLAGAIGDKRLLLSHAGTSSRYFYVPGVLILLLLLANVRRGAGARGVVCAVLLASGLVVGLLGYRDTLRWKADWPRWRDEVARWEQDRRYQPAIWPPPRWKVDLGSGAR